MAESLTNVEGVDTTWQRVQADDDLHVVLGSSVVEQVGKVRLLVTVVELRPGPVDPSRVVGGNSESVDTVLGKSVNVGLGVPGSVVVLESWATLVTEGLAQGPFVDGARGQGVESWLLADLSLHP